ncbi:MAG TPA: hypothetical protein VNZ53_41320 [Steroidobacteraceae bacterium]|nr:hypothetical protein [Steroidobacteraceae bacterium]
MNEPLMIRARPPLSTAVALLEAQGLPVSDITAGHLEHFFFAGSDGAPTGLVGLEIYGTDALLRSLVVARTRGARAWDPLLSSMPSNTRHRTTFERFTF